METTPWVLRVDVSVPGDPVPMARPRVVSGHAYVPERVRAYQHDLVRALLAAPGARCYLGPIRVALAFWMRRPQRLVRDGLGEQPHIARPDIDNLAKSALDAIGMAGLVADDAQVCELEARKLYAPIGAEAATQIVLWSLDSA